MSVIRKLMFTLEDLDGVVAGPVRILAIDKINAESSARNQGWPWADNPRIHSLMGFYAAKRVGITDAENYNDFMATLADFTIGDDEDDDDEDPTPADIPAS